MKKKVLLKIVIAVLITIAIAFISQALMPILGNDIAIDQLKNDDTYFIAMQAWHNTQNWLSLGLAMLWAGIFASISIDVYKFYKNTKIGENK